MKRTIFNLNNATFIGGATTFSIMILDLMPCFQCTLVTVILCIYRYTVMLETILLSVAPLYLILLNVTQLGVIWLSSSQLIIILLFVILNNPSLLNVNLMNAIQQSVILLYTTLPIVATMNDVFAECHLAQCSGFDERCSGLHYSAECHTT
jgi:hypothetical protein